MPSTVHATPHPAGPAGEPWSNLRCQSPNRFRRVSACRGKCYNDLMPTRAELHTTAAGQVLSNPGILGGRPVFAGTRVPVSTLFEYLADGLSLDYFLESFPTVSREQATGVIRYSLSQIERELA
jgi:uncharacterized protein (DUF433 family)